MGAVGTSHLNDPVAHALNKWFVQTTPGPTIEVALMELFESTYEHKLPFTEEQIWLIDECFGLNSLLQRYAFSRSKLELWRQMKDWLDEEIDDGGRGSITQDNGTYWNCFGLNSLLQDILSLNQS